jgi:galactose mutarotase-like enzyme
MALRIVSDRLTAEISEQGAELQRLCDIAGRDYLWDGDPAWWSGRAPILFPIVGTLNGDRFRWRGRTYALGRHGFARRSAFEVVEHDRDGVLLRLDANDATRAVWPFEFSLEMIYTLRDASLTMTGRVTNRGGEPMPVGFGFHPALRWPLPGAAGKEGHAIRFDRPEPAPVRRLDADGLLDPVPRPTPVEGDTLRLDDGLFADDALIFDDPASRALVYEAPGAARVAVDFHDMPQLGLWTKPGAGYLCIEPWHGFSDPAGFDGTLDEKPGMATIAPRDRRSFSMTITIG